MKKLPAKWWDVKASLAPDYKYLNDQIEFIDFIEIIDLRITGKDLMDASYDHHHPDPNSFGVYIRYTDEAVDNFNFNPSEWVADFKDRKFAVAFKQILDAFLSVIKKQREPYEI